MPRPTVILADCPGYDAGRIRSIVRAGLAELGERPHGRVLVKPNGVIAHRKYFPHAFTRAEFLDGVLGAVRDTSPALDELAVGERCGITVPTRLVFSEAGWNPVLKRHKAKRYCFDEETQVEVKLTREPRLRDFLYTPEPIARADYLINCPKFKAHPWTTVTFALKNFIGIQNDPDRLIDHDHRLDDKIADLQEIVPQRFIAIDAIVGGQDRMLTPTPFDLNMVIMGNNPVAVDAVCCRILGLDPAGIGHILAAHRKGFGPLAAEDIALAGDLTLQQACDRAQGFRTGLIRVEKYFEGSKVTALAGPPPEGGPGDYCWGGCPGAIEEAIEIVRQTDPRADARMKPLTVVFGGYEGEIRPAGNEPVVFVGDCARWKGAIAGSGIEIESLYRDRACHDPHRAKADDIFVKMWKTAWRMFRRKRGVMRIPGCPVSVAEHTLFLAQLGGTKNPYLMPESVVPFMRAYLASMAVRAFRRLLGKPRKIRAVAD